MACQLEFFPEDKNELDGIIHDIKVVKDSSDKVRKSMFAKHNELARKYTELHERIQIIERNICLGSTNM